MITIFISGNAHSECKTDRFGDVYCGKGKCEINHEEKVYCSKYQFGEALKNKYGSVVCGKGQCLGSTDFNEYYCSVVEGGGANIDINGKVKCYGACEEASQSMCESEAGK